MLKKREFTKKKDFKHHTNKSPFDRSNELEKAAEKLKNNFTVDGRLAVIKAKNIDKHSVSTI